MTIITIHKRSEYLIVCLLILLAAGLSATYLIHPIEHFDADEAIVGLMGRHILNGHIPAYFYGQGYMGSIEALVAAGYFAVFGSSILTLKLAPLTFYILFLILQYRLVRKFGGVALALLTLAITVVFSDTVILWSTKARGGFTETLFWGTLAYSLFFHLMDGYFRNGRGGWWRIFLLGSVIGIGFWNCSMVAYYYLPIALYLIIFGAGEIIGFRRDKIRHYPIIFTISVIIFLFLLITTGINLYFQQLPDYSYGHYQTLSPVEDFHKIGNNISQLFTLLLPKVIGVSYSSFKLDLGPTRLIRYSGISNGLTLALSVIFVIFLLLIKFARKRSFQEFIQNNRIYIFFLTSLIGCFSAISFSSLIQDSTAYRYLIPVISWLPFFLASFCLFLWRKSRLAGMLLAVIIIGGHSARLSANLPLPRSTTPEPLVSAIIKSLAEEKITRAFVNYWIAYPITFITGEEIIAAPYRSHDRYPPYTREIKASSSIAYIFKGYKQLLGRREENRLITDQTSYRKKRFRWGYLLIIDANQTSGSDNTGDER